MVQIGPNKRIHTAVGPPGAGKTEAFLSNINTSLAAGKRIVLAVPTLALIDEISDRAHKKKIAHTQIDHRAGNAVAYNLENALADEANTFIICTQESIRGIRSKLIKTWVMVIDELPKVVDYPDYSTNPVELRRILEYTEERDGQLWIPAEHVEVVKTQINTHKGESQRVNTSTLGPSAAHVFRLLLSNVEVFIDAPVSDGRRHIRAVEEYTAWWELISEATEVHVLTASIKSSEFEIFAEVYGFHFVPSEFTPVQRNPARDVTILPIVPNGQHFTKSMMTAPYGEGRYIDTILFHIKSVMTSTPLLFANKWAKLESAKGFRYVGLDCRGLNAYSDATEAILLFGGNPSPSEQLGLNQLAVKYHRDFFNAFITTRLLQPSLQAVGRTAVRNFGNSHPIRLYVQDNRVAEYLILTYFSDASLDWSLATTVPTKRDARLLSLEDIAKVKQLIASNLKDLPIHKITGISRAKIRQIRKSIQPPTR